MKALSILLVVALSTDLARAQEPQLRVVVIAGDGARDISGQKAVVDPVVEVQDHNGKPVEGAEVTLSLPKTGPGGSFENGTKTTTATTDAQGRVTARGIRMNHFRGIFDIAVTASYQGQTGTANIEARSVRGGRGGGAFGISTKTWLLVALGAVAIAGGIFAYKDLRGKTGGNVITLTSGIPVVGGPK